MNAFLTFLWSVKTTGGAAAMRRRWAARIPEIGHEMGNRETIGTGRDGFTAPIAKDCGREAMTNHARATKANTRRSVETALVGSSGTTSGTFPPPCAQCRQPADTADNPAKKPRNRLNARVGRA